MFILYLILNVNLLAILAFFPFFFYDPLEYLFRRAKSVISGLSASPILLLLFQRLFILSSYVAYTHLYFLMFVDGKMEKVELLPNPLQVMAQLCSLFFLFILTKERVEERHRLLLSLFLSLLSSLFLRGGSPQLLLLLTVCYLITIALFPLGRSDLAIFFVFMFYSVERSLSEWGFFLLSQQFFFFLISLLFAKGQPFPTSRLIHFSCAGAFLFVYGSLVYQDFYLQPCKLAILFSGACIIYICLRERTKWELLFCVTCYLSASVLASFLLPPTPTPENMIWGIPLGLFIFILFHFFALFGFLLFRENLPRRRQALVPIFYSLLFFLLGYFPGLAWLERWIEGFDLLLCILCLYSLIAEEEARGPRPKTDKKPPRVE